MIVIFHAFFIFIFRILALLISQRSMLGEFEGAILPFGIQRMCCSGRNLCSCPYMVCAASTLLLNLVWTFCAYVLKKTRFLCFVFLLPVGSFCSRSDCEKRKAIWDACVAQINQDPDLKKDFDTRMLAVADKLGQYTQTD
jgi:hypothetical protein